MVVGKVTQGTVMTIYLFVRMYVCTYVRRGEAISVVKARGQGWDVFLHGCPPYFFEMESLAEPGAH